MNRLTIKVDNGLNEIYFAVPDDPEGAYCLNDLVKYGYEELWQGVVNRLAAYEDTGHTPEDVAMLIRAHSALREQRDELQARVRELEALRKDWQRFRGEIAPLIDCEPHDIPNDLQQGMGYILNSVAAMQDEERNCSGIADELALTRRALELACKDAKSEDCGYCPICEKCEYSEEADNCESQLFEYYMEQAKKAGAAND